MRRHLRLLLLSLIASASTAYAHAEQSAPIPAREALGMFRLPDDVRVELVAAEPLVIDPVALTFDEDGRLYVVENRGYPTDESGRGIVALLDDPDGDGYFDKRTEFATGFDFPNGIMAWKGGVILTCAPDVLFLKDTDGDGKADLREVFLTGFAPGGSTQLRVSHPTLAIDNWIHLTNGLSGGDISNPSKPDLPVVKMGSLDGRYNPISGVFETYAGQAQFGLAFDDYGNKFVCSNRKHIELIMLQPADLARNPFANLTRTVAEIPDHGSAGKIFALSEARTTAFAHAGTFTAACGLSIYRGNALPDRYRGNAFVCDPTAALVHRDILEPNGSGLIAKRGEHEKDFLATPDNWCRPVFTANGPDGALYVCDMYRKTIEHPVYLPEEVRGSADFEGGKDAGRIYRLTGKSSEYNPRKLDRNDTNALLVALGDANGWLSDTAQRLLLEQDPANFAVDLRGLLTQPGASKYARAKALHLLYSAKAITLAELTSAITDPEALVREQALRIARIHLKDSTELTDLALPLVNDADARVRFVAALVLGDSEDPRAVPALAGYAASSLDDEWAKDVALSSAGKDLPGFSKHFFAAADETTAELPEFAEDLARAVAAGETPAATRALLEQVIPADKPATPLQLAVVRGVLDGVGSNGEFGAGQSSMDRLVSALSDSTRLPGQLDAIARQSIAEAGDNAKALPDRIRAIALLGHTSFDTAGEALGALIGPIAPPEVQLAAVQALARLQDDRVADYLATDAWGGFTAPVRVAATSALLTTSHRTLALLDGIERGSIPAWTIDPSTRASLQNHRDETIKAKATALFANVATSDRKKVYEEYKDCLTLTPSAQSGAEVYKEMCAQCHLFNDVGFAVGPDLTSIRSQPNEAVLMHILMPNWLLEQGYESYTVETTELESFSGIISSQNESSITLKCPLGVVKTIPRSEIASIQTSSKSLMPEELEKAMTKQQLRDLIAYLKGE
ncbi:MAG TPA: HEAT repeat domain-containing protein [Candidatus Hydrogenedentes bacterium]|nr:HEAT repeat domain-containing protein [Candidatus Hydrogenedentota bacterium]